MGKRRPGKADRVGININHTDVRRISSPPFVTGYTNVGDGSDYGRTAPPSRLAVRIKAQPYSIVRSIVQSSLLAPPSVFLSSRTLPCKTNAMILDSDTHIKHLLLRLSVETSKRRLRIRHLFLSLPLRQANEVPTPRLLKSHDVTPRLSHMTMLMKSSVSCYNPHSQHLPCSTPLILTAARLYPPTFSPSPSPSTLSLLSFRPNPPITSPTLNPLSSAISTISPSATSRRSLYWLSFWMCELITSCGLVSLLRKLEVSHRAAVRACVGGRERGGGGWARSRAEGREQQLSKGSRIYKGGGRKGVLPESCS